MTAMLDISPRRLPPDRRVVRRAAGRIPVTHPVLARPRSLYPGFDAWWDKVSAEERTCHVLEDAVGAVRGIAVIDRRSDTLAKLCTFCLVDGERGTGRAFLEAVCDTLAAEGYAEVYGTVLPEQEDVRAFFRRAGFKTPTDERLERRLAPQMRGPGI